MLRLGPKFPHARNGCIMQCVEDLYSISVMLTNPHARIVPLLNA